MENKKGESEDNITLAAERLDYHGLEDLFGDPIGCVLGYLVRIIQCHLLKLCKSFFYSHLGLLSFNSIPAESCYLLLVRLQ